MFQFSQESRQHQRKLTACLSSLPVVVLSVVVPAAHARRVQLHDLDGTSDGDVPGTIAAAGDTLFGTTERGGANSCNAVNCGMLWSSETSSNTVTKLHDFNRSTDGAGVKNIVVSGTKLFGTTSQAGRRFLGELVG